MIALTLIFLQSIVVVVLAWRLIRLMELTHQLAREVAMHQERLYVHDALINELTVFSIKDPA